MALFIATVSGNWATAGTWTTPGGSAPSATDTFQINSGVTVTVAASVTTAGGTVNGHLTINDAVVFTVQGDITLSSGQNTRLTLNAGATFRFDDDGTATVHTLKIGTVNASTTQPRLVCNGEAAKRCTVESITGGTNGRLSMNGVGGGGQVDATYTNFTRLGSSTLSAMDFLPDVNAASIYRMQTKCLVTSCGHIKSQGNCWGATIMVLDGVTFASNLSTYDFDLLGGNAKTTGTRQVTNCYSNIGRVQNCLSFTVTGNVFRQGWHEDGSLGADRTLNNNFIYNTLVNHNIVAGDMTNCYYYNAVNGGHGPTMHKSSGAQAITDCIFDGVASTATGDGLGQCIIGGASTAGPATYTIKRNIVLAGLGGNPVGALLYTAGSIDLTYVVEHNTFHCRSGKNHGLQFATYTAHAGMVSSFRSNLGYTTDATGYLISGATIPANDAVTVADFNARMAMTGITTLADAKFGTEPPGVNDVEVNPAFVASTRNVAQWDLSLGGPGTVANALAEMGKMNDVSGFDPAYTITALLAYVRAGFVPTNEAVHAAHDGEVGGWMGAVTGVVVITIPDDPTLATAAIVSGTELHIAWQDNSDDEDGFKIERRLGAGAFVEIATVGPNIESYDDTGLTPGTSYGYQIRAFNTAGDSAYTNIATAITTALVIVLPPTNVVATAGNSLISLSWTPSTTISPAVTEQRIYRSLTPNIFETTPNFTITNNTTNVFVDHTAFNATPYYYVIRAYAGSALVESPVSVQAGPTTPLIDAPPLPPTALTGVPGNGKIFLTWAPSITPGVTQQLVYRSLQSGVYGSPLATINDNVTEVYTDLTPVNGVPYFYIVRAAF